MRYKRNASRESPSADESQSSPNDAPKPVGANDERRNDFTCAGIIDDDDPANATACVSQHVGDPRSLHDPRASAPRRVEKDRIEHSAPNSESPIAKSAKAVLRGEVPAKLPPGGRTHDHPREMRRSSGLDLLEDAHVIQYARRLRAQILRAGLVTRKSVAIDDDDRRTRAGERERGRRSRRPSTNDDDVYVAHAGTRCGRQMRPLARASR